MSKVMVDREMLSRVAAHLEWDGTDETTPLQYAAKCDSLAKELADYITQPAEAEGVDFGFEDRSVKVSQEAYSIFLERERHHLAALSAVTAERDRLRKAFSECIESLNCEMLQKFGGQKPDDMHPVTRRDYDRDMAEIAEYRAALAAKEA